MIRRVPISLDYYTCGICGSLHKAGILCFVLAYLCIAYEGMLQRRLFDLHKYCVNLIKPVEMMSPSF